MLNDLLRTQVYLSRNASISVDRSDAMTNPELYSWVRATSDIIKLEMGKNADDNYDEKPDDFWEQR